MSVKLKKQKKNNTSTNKTPKKLKSSTNFTESNISDQEEDHVNEENVDHNNVDEDLDDGTGLAHESPMEDNVDDDEDDDEMDLSSLRKSGLDKPKKKRKKGIIYISNIPKHMNVTRIREILGEYGKIGRVYLQPEKLPGGKNLIIY